MALFLVWHDEDSAIGDDWASLSTGSSCARA